MRQMFEGEPKITQDDLNLALGNRTAELNKAVALLESYKAGRKKEHQDYEQKIAKLQYENEKLLRRLGMTEPEPVKEIPVNRSGQVESLWVLKKTTETRALSVFEVFAADSNEDFRDYDVDMAETFMLRHTPFSLMERLQGRDGITGLIVKRARLRDSA
jgi:hypothetical protein